MEQQVENVEVAKNKKAKVKKIVNTSLTVAECLLVVFLLIVSILTMGTTSSNTSSVASNPITGNSLFPVLSDSMAPTFKKGDLVYGKQFSNDPTERKEQIESLKGDDTLGENKGDIIMYWSYVNGMGTVVYGLQSNTTLMFCVIVLPLIALFIWNGYSFIRLIFVQKKDAAIEEITMQHEEEKAQILEEAKRLALEELKKEMKEKEKEKDKKSE